MAPENQQREENRSNRFPTTKWTVVLQAAEKGENAGTALESLCRAYWKPVYAFYRRSDHDVHDAEDLTQGFFADFLGRRSVDGAIKEKGKFRSYLLVAAKRFQANQHRRATALKRGGDQTFLSFDFHEVEDRMEGFMSPGLTPDRAFDLQWVLSTIDRAFRRLRDDYEKRGNGDLFAALKGHLEFAGQPSESHSVVARRFGLEEGAVRTASHRLKKRFQCYLREEVSATIAEDRDVDEEIAELFQLME